MKISDYKKLAIIFCLAVFAPFLINAIVEMPDMGGPDNPPNIHVAKRYLERGEEEAGCRNVVTNIIINYRGYDTLGEVTVIFTALCAVLAVMWRENPATSFSQMDISPNKPSVIVRLVITLVFPFIILFGSYVILHGEDSPGGGFQGGTVIGSAIILYSLVFGFQRTVRKIPPRLRVLFEGTAPLTFFAVGIIGLAVGLPFLSLGLPALSGTARSWMIRFLISVIEIAIGIGGGTIFTSIFLAMQGETK